MNPLHFLADLESKPQWLNLLADRFAQGNPFAAVPRDVDRVLLLGMGSSRFAAGVAATDLRVAGIAAAAEPASVDASWPPDPRTLVVAISATGASAETLDAVERYRGRSPIVALVNDPASTLAGRADVVVEMGAGEEVGGVACRTFQHTGLLLRALECHLTGIDEDLAGLARRRGPRLGRPAADEHRLAARGRDGARLAGRALPAGAGGAAVVGRAGSADGPRGPSPARRSPARPATGPTSTCT